MPLDRRLLRALATAVVFAGAASVARAATPSAIVVRVDIDRDGDVDVIESGDRGLVVWLNDGAGHLQAQPQAGDGLELQTPAGEWRAPVGPTPENLQTDSPPPALGEPTYQSGALVSTSIVPHVSSLRAVALRGLATSRAPPASR